MSLNYEQMLLYLTSKILLCERVCLTFFYGRVTKHRKRSYKQKRCLIPFPSSKAHQTALLNLLMLYQHYTSYISLATVLSLLKDPFNTLFSVHWNTLIFVILKSACVHTLTEQAATELP